MKHSIRGKGEKLCFVGEHDACEDVTFHEHLVPEMILIVDGMCQTDTSNQQFNCAAGDLLLIPARVSHNQIDHGSVRTLYLGFEQSSLTITSPQMIHLASPHLIEQCMWTLLQLYTRQWQGTPQSCQQLLHVLLMEVSVQLSPKRQTAHQRRLADLLHWVEDHLDQPLSVEVLADQTQLSAGRLFQLFQEHYNQSPMQYVQLQRMARARLYLQDPYLSVKRIACLCGYPDANLFIRTFRRHHDHPPRQWRLINCV